MGKVSTILQKNIQTNHSFLQIQRYFNKKPDDKVQKPKQRSLPQDLDSNTITYKVKPKKKPWGRREADKIEKRKKNQKIITNKSKNKIPKHLLQKYDRGPGVSKKGIKTTIHQQKQQKKEEKLQFAIEQAAKTEILLKESDG